MNCRIGGVSRFGVLRVNQARHTLLRFLTYFVLISPPPTPSIRAKRAAQRSGRALGKCCKTLFFCAGLPDGEVVQPDSLLYAVCVHTADLFARGGIVFVAETAAKHPSRYVALI